VAKVAASIASYGWTVPLLVAEDGEVIAGHGRLLAALVAHQGREPACKRPYTSASVPPADPPRPARRWRARTALETAHARMVWVAYQIEGADDRLSRRGVPAPGQCPDRRPEVRSRRGSRRRGVAAAWVPQRLPGQVVERYRGELIRTLHQSKDLIVMVQCGPAPSARIAG
jgi:hypothetical protein